jgi:O-antigen/teichoic acid export membrane protein
MTMRETKPTNVMRATSITVVGRMFVTGAAATSAFVVASTLGAKGAGTFAQVRVLPTAIAAILGAGLTIAIPYLIGARKYSVQAITETSMAIGIVLSVVGWGLWQLCGTLLHAHVYTALSHQAALAVGLSIPLQIFCNYLNSVQQGLQRFNGANVVLCIEEVASLVFVLPLLFGFPGGTTLIVVAAIGGTAVALLTAAILLMRDGVWPWPRWHQEIAVEAITLGVKGHIGRISNMLTWRLDVMILSFLASVEVVGCYAVASKVAELFRPLSASLTFVLRPVIASLPIAEARAQGVLLYRRFFAINMMAIAVMAVAGGPVIVRFFGPEFAAAVPAFQILLVGLAAHGADGVLNGYNVGIGRPELNTYAALVGLIITVIGDFGTIPTYGIVGAAVTSSVAYTAKAVALTIVFMATSGVSVSQLIGLKEYSPDPA